MKPTEIAEAIETCIACKQPAVVWGPPGIGKSQIIRQIGKSQIVRQTAERLQRQVIDIRASLLDPVDLRGLPSLDAGRTVWNAPGFLPAEGCPPTVVFLDELNRAPVMTQNALFQLVLDRKLGEYQLPDAVDIVAACNRETDGGGVQRMPQALANRFVHLEMEPDVHDWSQWAIMADIHPAVIAFIRFRPDLIFSYDPKERAFPTPRSWEFVSRITHQGPPAEIEHALFAGAVGPGAAVEYSAFMRLYRELPSLTAIELNPDTTAVPDGPAARFAVAAGTARLATVKNFGRLMRYWKRMPPEYGVCAVRDAIKRDSTLTATPEYLRWSIENQDVIA